MWLLVSLGKDAGDAAFRDKHIVVTLLGLSPKEARIQLCRQPTGSARWRDESVECGDGPGLSSQSGSGPLLLSSGSAIADSLLDCGPLLLLRWYPCSFSPSLTTDCLV